MTCVRLSMLYLYIHLFSSHRRFPIYCYIFVALCTCWYISNTVIIFLLCRPLAFNWDTTIPGGSCGNINAAYLSIMSANFFLDSGIALLPTMVLLSLQMPTKQKIGIGIMFALGVLYVRPVPTCLPQAPPNKIYRICITSIVRIALYQLATGFGQLDFTWSGSLLYLICGLEVHLSCVLACMPLLRPLGERLNALAFVPWAKTLVSTSKMTKISTPTPHPGSQRREGPYNEAAAVGQKRHWKRLADDGNNGIEYSMELEQRRFTHAGTI